MRMVSSDQLLLNLSSAPAATFVGKEQTFQPLSHVHIVPGRSGRSTYPATSSYIFPSFANKMGWSSHSTLLIIDCCTANWTPGSLLDVSADPASAAYPNSMRRQLAGTWGIGSSRSMEQSVIRAQGNLLQVFFFTRRLSC
ncbi:hypothetical protein ONS95_002728 [Cadophora gregata]|uniref:uncharacterized protein n=1 Tax=Cadophora gregata TaxID=51156 RepID=UPI0026DC790C|nr:uncharacterized protein ONS95_002728 [Cadophora gregata]KAK0110071.1 hypothetical protein ONS95_002728 [Cadophora gregata]